MAQKKENTIPNDKLTLYENLVATIPSLQFKGVTMPYTSLNGHMFSFLDAEGNLGLRLSKNEREAFIRDHNTNLCEAHGTILKEYVLVPEVLFRDVNKMKKYFIKSLEYVSSLKPKPNKKRNNSE